MNLSATILGKAAVKRLEEAASSAVLTIGSDRLTRGELAAVGCYNFVAARIVSAVLHQELAVKNLRQVFDEVPPQALALPRIGAISLAVLGAAFEAKGIGGDRPLENYVQRHAGKGNGVVTWSTIKQHERARQGPRRGRRR